VSSAFGDKAFKDMIARGDKDIMEIIERSPRSVSMILDPAGNIVGEPISDCEGIVYADIDTSLSVEPKQFHDVTGYYNRFDIFDLKIDRSPRDPARFVDNEKATAGPLKPWNAAFDGGDGAQPSRPMPTL